MKNDAVMEAVRNLRAHLGLTQTQFAARLGNAMQTIQRWEKVVPPKGKALAQLERVAREDGQPELAEAFRKALVEELGTWDTSEYESIGIEPRNETEKLLQAAIVTAYRNPEFTSNLAGAIRHLREPAEACIKIIERHKLSARVTAEADRLINMGADPAAIAKELNVPEQDIRNRASFLKMARTLEDIWAKRQTAEKPR